MEKYGLIGAIGSNDRVKLELGRSGGTGGTVVDLLRFGILIDA